MELLGSPEEELLADFNLELLGVQKRNFYQQKRNL
jgi:hypothetical protein